MKPTGPRELPIIFTAESVNAILAGRKVQTRRLSKFVPFDGVNLSFSGLSAGHYCTGAPKLGWCLYSRGEGGMWNQRSDRLFSRFLPGDRIWVKETWGLHRNFDETDWLRGSLEGMSRDDVLADWSLAFRTDWAQTRRHASGAPRSTCRAGRRGFRSRWPKCARSGCRQSARRMP